MRTRHVRPDPIVRSAFAGFCFPPDVIVLSVRWYLRLALSCRDVGELLAERGVEVDYTTVYRWVQRFTPLLTEAARPCRHAVGDRWQGDETHVKGRRSVALWLPRDRPVRAGHRRVHLGKTRR
jgi:transposase, IS6 family